MEQNHSTALHARQIPQQVIDFNDRVGGVQYSQFRHLLRDDSLLASLGRIKSNKTFYTVNPPIGTSVDEVKIHQPFGTGGTMNDLIALINQLNTNNLNHCE